jgi:hypothetical protein
LANDIDTIPSTGGRESNSITNDSVLISYDDLRIVNSKLIELEYEKEINDNLRNVVSNDSVAINNLRSRIDSIQRHSERYAKRVKRQRNTAVGTTILFAVSLIISLL